MCLLRVKLHREACRICFPFGLVCIEGGQLILLDTQASISTRQTLRQGRLWMYSQLSMDARWKVSHSSSKQMFRWKINLIGATTHHPPLSFTSEKDFFFWLWFLPYKKAIRATSSPPFQQFLIWISSHKPPTRLAISSHPPCIIDRIVAHCYQLSLGLTRCSSAHFAGGATSIDGDIS